MSTTLGSKVAITNRRGDKYMEDYTGGISVLDVFHKHIHEGEAYIASHRFTGIANDASVNVMIQSSATKEIHLEFNLVAGGDFWGDIFSESTHNAGTAISGINLNLGSDQTCEASISYGASGGSDGNQIMELMIPGGSGPFAVGGQFGSRVEIVVPINTKILFKVTNKSGGSSSADIKVLWYEHLPE